MSEGMTSDQGTTTTTRTLVKAARLPRKPGVGTYEIPRGSKKIGFRERDRTLVVIGPETTERTTRRVLVIREGDKWPVVGDLVAVAIPERHLGSWRDAGFDYHAFDAGSAEG